MYVASVSSCMQSQGNREADPTNISNALKLSLKDKELALFSMEW